MPVMPHYSQCRVKVQTGIPPWRKIHGAHWRADASLGAPQPEWHHRMWLPALRVRETTLACKPALYVKWAEGPKTWTIQVWGGSQDRGPSPPCTPVWE